MHRTAFPAPAAARPGAPVRTLGLRVQLPSPQLDDSVGFYAALGLRTVERIDDGERRAALLSLPEHPSLQLLLEEAAAGEPIELRLEVESLPTALRALSPWVPWAAARADGACGSSVCVTDPGGHPVVLVQAPG